MILFHVFEAVSLIAPHVVESVDLIPDHAVEAAFLISDHAAPIRFLSPVSALEKKDVIDFHAPEIPLSRPAIKSAPKP